MSLNDVENANRAFSQALILSPDDSVIIVNNILTLALLDRKAEAKTLAEKFNNILAEDSLISEEVQYYYKLNFI